MSTTACSSSSPSTLTETKASLRGLTMAELKKAIKEAEEVIESEQNERQENIRRQQEELEQKDQILESFLSSHEQEVEALKRRHQEENERTDLKVAETLSMKENLQQELDILLARVGTSSTPTIKVHECYVCLDEMRPPVQIFNCNSGHALCKECLDKMQPQRCGQCPSTSFGRATALEQLIRSMLGIDG